MPSFLFVCCFVLFFVCLNKWKPRRSRRRRGRENWLPLFDFLQASSLFQADALKVGREERRGSGGGAENYVDSGEG